MSKRTHVMPYRVAFSDCDPAKIVFFAKNHFDIFFRDYKTHFPPLKIFQK